VIERLLKPHLVRLFGQYPVVTVTGPRQSGKTTLCRTTFPDLAYINLESPDQRELATDDPRGFLRHYRQGVIIDEIQRVPDLLSYIQVEVDERRENALFVLTGSQQFGLSQAISQSLAGRTALLRLLPLSIQEATRLQPDLNPDAMMYTGFYPRIYDQTLDPTQALGAYFATYVERDVRQISEIRNLTQFRTFIRLCAGRIGQLLNIQSLGNDAGVSHTTARQWLSLLEASYLAFMLPPYHANVSKRLIKSPKLYFYDVGLAAYLLGIENSGQIFTHPLKGNLFENLVVVEALKHRYNQGKENNLHFYRDSAKNEIDLLYPVGHRLIAVEIKAGATVSRSYFRGFDTLREMFPDQIGGEILVYGGDQEHTRHTVHITSPQGFVGQLKALEGAL
jgi:uncharacterized protein